MVPLPKARGSVVERMKARLIRPYMTPRMRVMRMCMKAETGEGED